MARQPLVAKGDIAEVVTVVPKAVIAGSMCKTHWAVTKKHLAFLVRLNASFLALAIRFF